MNHGLGHKPNKPSPASFRLVPDARGLAHDPCPSAQRVDLQSLRKGPIVVVTGTGSNAGKTWVCEQILRQAASNGRPAGALKVTRTHLESCPRQHGSCGVCDDLDRPWRLVTDSATLSMKGKDTRRYLDAGADDVRWLIVDPRHVGAGLMAAVGAFPSDLPLIAEGNSFRDHVKSVDLTVMAVSDGTGVKPSAFHVLDRVDAFVGSEEAERAAHEVSEWPLRPWLRPESVAGWVWDALDRRV